MKQSKYTGKITARFLLLIFLQILRQLHCTCYMVTQLTNTQKSFFAPRLGGSIKQQKRIIHYWILMLRLFFCSPQSRPQVWILKKLTYSGRKHRLQQVDMAAQVREVLAIPRNRGFVPRATRLQGHVTKRNDGVWGRECGLHKWCVLHCWIFICKSAFERRFLQSLKESFWKLA